MINVKLSTRSLAAARSVDPYVTPAAVHAAVEIAVLEQLREVVSWDPDAIQARIARIEKATGGS
ncbi:hypothetical protein ACL02T_15455 [Pseudonocardia sp. RS010]|uniref:hypothetical protein n=1 Tax=Pseudonocardia sp. RS010 TaxID=3385979 RepID=UPI0039A1F474